VPIRPSHRLIRTAAVLLLAGATTLPALGQVMSDETRQRLTWLTDWMHYTRIAQFDLARANAKALLDSGITGPELVNLVEDVAKKPTEFTDVVLSAQRYAELEEVAAGLQKLFEQGRLEAARNAEEITRNIELLTGTQRERLLGRQRLVFAGEYAMPQLLAAFLDRGNVARQTQVRTVMVELGRQAVIPLVTALPKLDPGGREAVVALLGDIPYYTSVPFLYELRAAPGNDAVRTACDRAIEKITQNLTPNVPIAERFYTLAGEYYGESPSLTSFPGEDVQLLWSYDPGAGLIATPVATPVYHEAMAMRLCERALRHDARQADALALWLAANFSREIDTPEGYVNPVYGADRRDAMYYAVAAGASADQRVLGRALDTRDTPLARRAIAAIDQTAGGAALWSGEGQRRPLLEAIGYPNRRVQYEAALALGTAQPRTPFEGSDRVVPILASAIRNASARYALVVAKEPEVGTGHADTLRARGFTLLPPARQLADAEQAINEAPGLDLIVAHLPAAETDQLITQMRGRPNLRAVPVLALVDAQGYAELGAKYQADQLVRIARTGLNPEQVAAASNQLIDRATGGLISAEEATQYKIRALTVLRDLALAASTVLNVGDAAAPLIGALSENTGGLRLTIAEVLSYIPLKSAQVALMDAALAAGGDEQIALLAWVSNSAKRNGNMLDQRHIASLLKLATGSGSDAQATAAAALMGALNLPNAELVPLIVGRTQ
jgi:hypothetical protein